MKREKQNQTDVYMEETKWKYLYFIWCALCIDYQTVTVGFFLFFINLHQPIQHGEKKTRIMWKLFGLILRLHSYCKANKNFRRGQNWFFDYNIHKIFNTIHKTWINYLFTVYYSTFFFSLSFFHVFSFLPWKKMLNEHAFHFMCYLRICGVRWNFHPMFSLQFHHFLSSMIRNNIHFSDAAKRQAKYLIK